MPISHPLNVAVPLTADRGLAAQLSVAPAGVVIVRVIELVPEVVLPEESWIATTGCAAKSTPLAVFPGDTTNTSLVAVLKIEIGALTADCRVPEVAVRV